MTIPLTALANPGLTSTTFATSTTTPPPPLAPNPTTQTVFPTETPTSTDQGTADAGLSSSAKGGIIGGVVGGVAIFSAIGFFLFRRRPVTTNAPRGRVYIPPDIEDGNEKVGGNLEPQRLMHPMEMPSAALRIPI